MKTLEILLITAFLAAQCQAATSSKKQYRHQPRTASSMQAEKLITLGQERLAAKDIPGAIAAFDKATRTDSRSANAFFHLGNVYYNRAFTETSTQTADKGDTHRAIDAYESALAVDPALGLIDDPFMLYHGLAQCYEAQGNLEGALRSVQKATQVSQQNPMPYLYGARIRYKMQEPDKSAANLYYSVRRARRINKYPALAKLVKSNPLFSSLLSIPQNKIILDSYDAVEAGVLTEEEAQKRIRDFEPYRDALTNLPTRAPESLSAAREDPKVEALISKAHRAFTHGKYHEAIRTYQAAMAEDAEKGTIDPVQKSLMLERIGTSYRQLGLMDNAISVYKLAVRELPHNTAALYQLALCYSASGKLGLAMTSLNQALDSAHSKEMLRKTLLMTRTDQELSPLRELTRYADIIKSHTRVLSRR